MKLLSLNVNDFGGKYNLEDFKKRFDRKAYTEWDKIDKANIKDAILSYIFERSQSPDFVVLQEFDLITNYAQDFIRSMKQHEYEMCKLPSTELSRPSITVAFIKKNIQFEIMENPHNKGTNKTLRGTAIKILEYDLIIYGTHIPYNYKFWEEVIKFYESYKNKKIIMIGDFNVYEKGTWRMAMFKKLLKAGAIDAWVYKGCSPDVPTHRKSRIDYAIMSPLLKDSLSDITIDPSLWIKDITDHAALLVEFDMSVFI